MDPVTCLAAATTAFTTVKRLVEAGREMQDVTSQIGTWFKAASDLKASIEEAENPRALKKMLQSTESIEQQAINIQLAKEKHREMETQLREMWMYRFGLASYREMIQTRRQIEAQRDAAVHKKRRTAQFWIDAAIIGLSVLTAVGVLLLFLWLINTKGRF